MLPLQKMGQRNKSHRVLQEDRATLGSDPSADSVADRRGGPGRLPFPVGAKALNPGSARAAPSLVDKLAASLPNRQGDYFGCRFICGRIVEAQIGFVVGQPVLVFFQQQHPNQADARSAVREDSHHSSPAADLQI